MGNCFSSYPSLSKQLQTDKKERQKIASDGNCLFRAICHQVEGNETNYPFYRREAVNYIAENMDEFKPYFHDEAEPIQHYIIRMRRDGAWGDNYCISALAMKFRYKFIIYESYRKKLEICYTKENEEPSKIIYLAYLDGRHYNSVVDKGTATNKAVCCG